MKTRITLGLLFVFAICFLGAQPIQIEDQDTTKLASGLELESYAEEPVNEELFEELNNQIKNNPDASKKPAAFVLYDRGGHPYTTFIVAQIAGYDLDRSYILSFFSQLPDEERQFTATNGFWYINPEQRLLVMSTLHSLHGGVAAKVIDRRSDLKNILYSSIRDKTLDDWQIGIILHAYADSYAHTKGEGSNLKAYGYVIGHAMHPFKTDTIAYYPDKFKEYVKNLFEVLNVNNYNENVLNDFYKYIDQLSKNRWIALGQLYGLAMTKGYNQKDCDEKGKAIRMNIKPDDIITLMKNVERSFSASDKQTGNLTIQMIPTYALSE